MDINIGIAVATDDGLLVPVISHADALSLADTSSQRRDIVQRAKDRSLRADDMAGGTFTISNLGMFEIQQFDALLNVP